MTLSSDHLDQALENGEVNFEAGYITNDLEGSASENILPDVVTVLPLSEEAEEKVSSAGDFYPNEVTLQNMGLKTMIEEGYDAETIILEDIQITINGYQITEFEPSVDQTARYEDFKEGDSATSYFVFALSGDDYELYEGRSVQLNVTVNDADYRAINDYQELIFTIKEGN